MTITSHSDGSGSPSLELLNDLGPVTVFDSDLLIAETTPGRKERLFGRNVAAFEKELDGAKATVLAMHNIPNNATVDVMIACILLSIVGTKLLVLPREESEVMLLLPVR